MSVTPRVSLVAFEDRANRFIFVAIPDQRGRYLRTDRSVALVECPQCGAMVGEPCHGHTGDKWSSVTHVRRRNRAKASIGWIRGFDDVLCEHEPPESPQPIPDEWMEAAS